ncbi:MAG: metallophosphoesterase family protein [Planctomycetota bacterium]
MSRIALISDLHSNVEALTAVMEDIAGQDVDSIVCLGDVIGYGPNPREVLGMVRDCAFVLLGNHEEGLLYYGEDFNPKAQAALNWTREQLNDSTASKDENYAFWMLIDGMKKLERDDRALYVHGSLIHETKDYVLPEDIENRDKMDEIFARMDRDVCFFGHTHVPGVWTSSGRFLRPDEVGGEYVVPPEKVVINVGSVGQPRDGDNRSCYALFDGERVTFRRVEYDYRSTMRKIMKIDALSDTLAARLKVGR